MAAVILVPRAHDPSSCGKNRELWEQPFQACAVHADCVKPDGQNSVISFVILKWLLTELSFSERWSRGTRLWERDCTRARVRKMAMATNICTTFTDMSNH